MLEQLSHGGSTTAFLVWNGILGFVAVAGGIAATLLHRRTRAITVTPTSKISSASGGYLALEGRAKANAEVNLKSPLTGTPCVWYEYEITRQMGGRGSDSHSTWVTVERGRSEDAFLLADETGQCLVDPQDAKVITAPEDTDRWLGRSARPSRGPEKRGSRWGLFPGQSYGSFRFGQGIWFSNRKDYRYSERRIPAEGRLYALGRLEKGRGGPRGARASVSEVLRTWKQDRAELLARFDADRDGRIDPAEWETARREAESEVGRAATPASEGEAMDVLCAPRQRSQTFLISTVSQRELIARYRLLSRIALAAAALAVLGMGIVIAGGL